MRALNLCIQVVSKNVISILTKQNNTINLMAEELPKSSCSYCITLLAVK